MPPAFALSQDQTLRFIPNRTNRPPSGEHPARPSQNAAQQTKPDITQSTIHQRFTQRPGRSPSAQRTSQRLARSVRSSRRTIARDPNQTDPTNPAPPSNIAHASALTRQRIPNAATARGTPPTYPFHCQPDLKVNERPLRSPKLTWAILRHRATQVQIEKPKSAAPPCQQVRRCGRRRFRGCCLPRQHPFASDVHDNRETTRRTSECPPQGACERRNPPLVRSVPGRPRSPRHQPPGAERLV